MRTTGYIWTAACFVVFALSVQHKAGLIHLSSRTMDVLAALGLTLAIGNWTIMLIQYRQAQRRRPR